MLCPVAQIQELNISRKCEVISNPKASAVNANLDIKIAKSTDNRTQINYDFAGMKL